MKVLWVAAAALACSLVFAAWVAGRPVAVPPPLTLPSPNPAETLAGAEVLPAPGWGEDETPDPVPGDDPEPEPAEPPSTATLGGRVSVAHGSLPEAVSIAVIGRGLPAEEQETDEASTDSDGAFEHEVAPGTYELVFRSAGYLPVRVDGIAISAGEQLDGIDVVLERGERVGGRVVDEQGEPVANLAVLLDGHGFRMEVQTDEQGDFAFEGVPRVWEGQETSFRVRAADPWGGADTQRARAGDTGLLLRLAKRGQVSGDVVDTAGAAMPFAAVYVAVPDPTQDFVEDDPFGTPPNAAGFIGLGMRGCSEMPECLADGRADEQGHFELSVPEVDGLKLAASGTEAARIWRTAPVPVDAHARGVQLVLAPPLELHLRLVEPDGTPAEGEVAFEPKAPEWAPVAASRAHSDAEGNVTLLGWPGIPATLVPEGALRMKFLGDVPEGITVTHRAHRAAYDRIAIIRP